MYRLRLLFEIPRPNETCHHIRELVFCHINMPHFPPLVAVAVCTSFSAGGVNSNCWQQACLGASRGATPRYRRLFPASLICMLLDTVERKVGTAVLCQQWRNGTSRIVVMADTRLRNRSRICCVRKLSTCGQQITPFPINQSTRCNNFSSLLLDVYSYVELNMFRASSRPSSGAQQMQ